MKIAKTKVSFLIRLDARGQRRRSYETTPKWHDFLVIKLAALAASGRTEQRTAACDELSRVES
jgi:hypothetical protein